MCTDYLIVQAATLVLVVNALMSVKTSCVAHVLDSNVCVTGCDVPHNGKCFQQMQRVDTVAESPHLDSCGKPGVGEGTSEALGVLLTTI